MRPSPTEHEAGLWLKAGPEPHGWGTELCLEGLPTGSPRALGWLPPVRGAPQHCTHGRENSRGPSLQGWWSRLGPRCNKDTWGGRPCDQVSFQMSGSGAGEERRGKEEKRGDACNVPSAQGRRDRGVWTGPLWGLDSFTPGGGGGVTPLNLSLPGWPQDAHSLTGHGQHPELAGGWMQAVHAHPRYHGIQCRSGGLHGTPQCRCSLGPLLQVSVQRLRVCRVGEGEKGGPAQDSVHGRPQCLLRGHIAGEVGKSLSGRTQRLNKARWVIARVGG